MRTQDRSIYNRDQPLGLERFRSALAALLTTTKRLQTSTDNLLVTNGLAEALTLVCRGLLQAGDPIAVESLGSQYQWDVLRQSGHPLIPMEVDGEGVVMTSVQQALERGARMLFVTPLRQYPTTVTLPAERRRALVALAQLLNGFIVLALDTEGNMIGLHSMK